MTRRKGGSFESRSLQAYPLQRGYGSQREKINRNGAGIPLERRSKRSAAPTERSNWHDEKIPYRSGGEQRGRSATLPPQRKKEYLSLKALTFGELINHYVNHELPRLSKSARKANKSYIKNWIEPQWHGHVADNMKTMQIQDWLDKIQRPDGTKLKIKKSCRRSSHTGSDGNWWNAIPSAVKAGTRPSWCFNGRAPKQQNLHSASDSAPDVVRQTLEQLPLREATMALIDAARLMSASELVALKWRHVGWETRILRPNLQSSKAN